MTDGPQNVSKSPEQPFPGHEPLTVVDWATHAASSAYHETADLVRAHPVVAISAGLYFALLLAGKGGFAKSGAALLAEVESAANDEKLLSGIAHGATTDSLPSLKIEGDHILAKNHSVEPAPKLVHVSNTPDLTTLHDVDPGLGEKPNGLWYSPDHAWAKSALYSFTEKLEGHAYLVDTSKANILKVSTPDELKALHQKYGAEFDEDYKLVPSGRFSEHSRIDWKKVKADYDGIQFENVENDHALPRWYRGLDVDSGSIWNASKVELTPLGKMPPTEFEGYNLASDSFELELEGKIDPAKRDEFDANYENLLNEQLKPVK